MKQVCSVRMYRAEGPTALCRERETRTIGKAQAIIDSLADTYPKLGYHKHDVTVMWDDGTVMRFRLDLMHRDNPRYHPDCNDLELAVREELRNRFVRSAQNKEAIG